MLFLFNAFSFENDTDIADKVKQAAEDERAFEVLAKEFEKRNKVIASRVTGRFITESDDEWSVALLAFYEAVRSYQPGKGSFVTFSEMVIKRRLIDHIRSQGRHSGEVAADLGGTEDGSKVKNISGYQIQYSTDSSFTNSKTVNVKKSATSKKIKKLASKTKYYVRVRTYKTVNGVKTYSTWSSTKSVKTR